VSQHLVIERHGDVAVVRIDRPPANAIDLDLLRESEGFLEELAADEPAAVVLTGREGFFSAGLDLKAAPALDADGQREMVSRVNRMFAGWYAFPRPVVCAVNGHAVAGGLILALCGDYRVGSTEGKLGLTELRAGIPYPSAAIAIVQAELEPAAARVLVLRAELIDPPAALEYGVVDELVSADEVVARALDVAAELGRMPALAYGRIKHQLRARTIEYTRAVASGDADPINETWLSEETGGAAAAILSGGSRPAGEAN
jgi:enoyl-CoA hydratase